jgi:hypothetical protein
MTRGCRPWPLAAGAALLAACSSEPRLSGGTTSTSTTSPSHPSLPQVLDLGGHVLAAPRIQPIAYPDDPDLADMEAFLQELTRTSYWSDTTSQYGVGPLTVLPPIVRSAPAPATLRDSQIQADLATNTTGSSPAWGLASAGTVYLFLLPPQTIADDDSFGTTGCKEFDGYHREAILGGEGSIPYAVGCACPGYDGPAVTDLQERTVAVSHELTEAATDPFLQTGPAWAEEDDAHIVWTFVTGGELADLCELDPDANLIPPGGTYMVQRSWSNAAAAAGEIPCVPLSGPGPYFASAPILPDTLAIPAGGSTLSTPGVKIPAGGTRTVDVDLWSDGPTSGPWTVSARDASAMTMGTGALELTLDRSTGQDGDTLHLTIQVIKADTTLGAEPFIVTSSLNGQTSLWMAFVGQ